MSRGWSSAGADRARPRRSRPAVRAGAALGSLWLLLAPAVTTAGTDADASGEGRRVYDFYCYQCHGYAGDARTLAATHLDPPPRDFTRADPAELTRERMLASVRDGRPGTAMMPFASVLDQARIAAVVDFVRGHLMTRAGAGRRYHTAANGWPAHERYAEAFPFATGEADPATPPQSLSAAARRGRALFLASCVSCHDRGGGQAQFEPRALSWPLQPKTPAVDGISGATAYAAHDRAPAIADLAPPARRGEALFQANCAFCHGADGSGRNWIGAFLEPHARDLRAPGIAARADDALVATILDGVPDSSMPAWRHVLDEAGARDIVAYLRAAILGRAPDAATPAASAPVGGPAWTRVR